MPTRGTLVVLGLFVLIAAIVGLMSSGGNLGRQTDQTNAPPHAVDQ